MLAGSGAGSLHVVVAHAAKSGFETAIPVRSSFASYEVQALDAGGKVIGTSKPFGGSAGGSPTPTSSGTSSHTSSSGQSKPVQKPGKY